ncbi:MAG: LysM peptidoglycan-binding domain-containing protein [Chloroflexi bacterium]|nr:LysM peptidoglycan-binding domain-containing protein [Chloroflexota bacterium]
MDSIARSRAEQHEHSLLGLAGLVAGLAAGAAALVALAGPPRLPDQPPSWDLVVSTLQGSVVPLDALAYVLTTAAWLVWLWMASSLVLRLFVATALAASHGTSWVKGLCVISDRVTPPIVRRLVDGAIVALIVANVLSRSPASGLAAPLSPKPTAPVMIVQGENGSRPDSQVGQQDSMQATVVYRVRPGDTLWSIAEGIYGDGAQYPRLVQANLGRLMSDGRPFTAAGVIHPGWVLLVPFEARAAAGDEQPTYIVREGDTLREISARLLGDESRWQALYDENRGTARLGDGRVLENPDLIWPGLRLELPSSANMGGEPPPGQADQMGVPSYDGGTVPSGDEATLTDAPDSATMAEDAAPAGQDGAARLPVSVVMPEIAVDFDVLGRVREAPPLLYGAAGLAAAAVGGAAVFARRRARRSLDELPIPTEPEPDPNDDFAEAEFVRVLAHRLHGGEVEPVVLVAGDVLRFLADQGVWDASVVMARQGRSSVALTLTSGLLAFPRLLDLAEGIGVRLGAKALASPTRDHDVVLQIGGLKTGGVLTLPDERRLDALCLFPLGLLPKGETLYANWRALGHVLISGPPEGGGNVVLTSLIAALAARIPPEELRLSTVARRSSLPDQMQLLPHLARDFVDPIDQERVSEVLQQVRAELLRRMRGGAGSGDRAWAPTREMPELVLVIGEMGVLSDAGGTLSMIGLHGPAYGVRLVAATTRTPALSAETLANFSTRLVLGTRDQGDTVRLLGQSQEPDVGSGDLLARIDGRASVRARGFRVSDEHLRDLVRMLRKRTVDRSSRGAGAGATNAADTESTSDSGSEVGSETSTDGRIDGHQRDSPAHAADSRVPLDAGQPVNDEDHAPPNSGLPTAEGKPPDIDAVPAGEGGWAPAPALASASARDIVDGPALDGGALVQVGCLGEFAVQSRGRTITPRLGDRTCYKAFELLAFLAAHADGAVSKDMLMAALWPDADADRAGNRMRVEMARLRALLARQVSGIPTDAVRCERDGTCRLDARFIESDVQKFLALCRDGVKLHADQAKVALEQALAHYQGNLLSGQGARFFEWVDDPGESGLGLRARYREEWSRATVRLAQLFSRDGDVEKALPLYRILLKTEPTLEDVVRDLFRCYHQLGDLGSLIREERRLRRALKEAFFDPEDPVDDPACYEPEPDTRDLFERLRRELEAMPPARVSDSAGRRGG